MAFLWKKERSIIQKITGYLKQTDVTMEKFILCMKDLIENPHGKRDTLLEEDLHKAESKADDIRREIEYELYNKALIPEIRGDILGILETLDRIPNEFQSICFQISLQQIEIPESLKELYLELVTLNIDSFKILREALDGFFYKKDIYSLTHKIDTKESESDRMERRLIKALFELDLDKADKILIKEVVIHTGNISDMAEDVADRMNLAIVKRRI